MGTLDFSVSSENSALRSRLKVVLFSQSLITEKYECPCSVGLPTVLVLLVVGNIRKMRAAKINCRALLFEFVSHQ